MKILVTGANGQLGSDIIHVLLNNNIDAVGLTHETIELEDAKSTENALTYYKPEIIINTAAYHNVAKCEENKNIALAINTIAPKIMAQYCQKSNAKLIHISTDYVFDGTKQKPYTEKDIPNPLNYYGFTKYKGEQAILNTLNNAIILRVSALYGNNPCRAKGGLNFVQLMLKLAIEKGEVTVVTNEIVSPTNTLAIANQIVALLNSDIKGIVHATSEGECSWYDFAKEIFDTTNTPVILNKSISDIASAVIKRPAYSVLENEVLKNNNLNLMPHWKTSLHQYLNNLTQTHEQKANNS